MTLTTERQPPPADAPSAAVALSRLRWAVAVQSAKPVARSIRWSPLLVVAGVALVLVWLLRPDGPDVIGTIGSLRLGAYLLAAGAALAVDDRAAATLASSPTPRALRRAVRLVVGLAPVALAWCLLVVAAWAVSGAGWSRLPTVAVSVEALAMVAFAVATATIAGARADGVGGSVGGPALTLLVLALLMVQMRWPKHLTMFPMTPADPVWTVAHQRWGVLAIAAAAAVVGASVDPARRLRLGNRLAG